MSKPTQPGNAEAQLSWNWPCPIQTAYEQIRPIVLYQQSPQERAKQLDCSAKTLRRKTQRFAEQGMLGLGEALGLGGKGRLSRLPSETCQYIADLLAQYPAFKNNELADLCGLRFGHTPDGRSVQKVRESGLPPTTSQRRYLPYHQLKSAQARRQAIITLREEGWQIKSIAAYLLTRRETVYLALQRWEQEGVAGLADHSHAPKQPARKVTLAILQRVRQLGQNPLLGAHRLSFALKQEGILLSPRTCGRLLAQVRTEALTTEPKPTQAEQTTRPLPFLATRRHEYWSLDLRYIPSHQLGGGYIYVISIIENYSRAILASAVTRHQDLSAYLIVLYSALRQQGCPQTLVSDSGSIFLANQAQAIYQALGITKKEIEPGQPRQNLIETQWSIQRRMADYYFEQAKSWADLVAAHAKWMLDFNYQDHWAHLERSPDMRSPAAVLGGIRGRATPTDLERLFGLRFERRLSKSGRVRLWHWWFYAEAALAGQRAGLWLYQERLTVEHQRVSLSEYSVEAQPAAHKFSQAQLLQAYETPYRSLQPTLWPLSALDWQPAMPIEATLRRPRPKIAVVQPRLFSFSQEAG